jgi:predicted transcriptional regulator
MKKLMRDGLVDRIEDKYRATSFGMVIFYLVCKD